MSIDTLLEAARYLEWQAQQQQITREEEQRRDKAELHSRDPEPWRVEVLASSAQPIRVNHATWGEEPHHHQQQQQHHLPSAPAPPPPPPPLPPPPPSSSSLPPSQVPIAIIPMVPVVTATASVPHHPLVAPVAAATATVATTAPGGGSAPLKNGTSSPPQQRPAPPPHLAPCAAQTMKAEPNSWTPQTGGSPSQSHPAQVQISYPASLIAAAAATSPAGPQHALLPQPTTPTSQPRTNGMALDDMRGTDGKRRPGGAGTREVHNKLEKNRRAHLKECFETLKKNVPNVDEKKTSNLSVLRSALRYIQTLKRKEKEYEHEMERLAREKIATQQRLTELKNELSQCVDVMEIDRVLRQTVQPEEDQASTSTASEGEEVFDQDMDEDIKSPLPILLSKALPPILHTQSALLPPHLSIQHTALPLSGVLTTPSPSAAPPPQAIAPAPHHPLPPPTAIQVQPTVIAHAHVSHPSVIQAVNHVLPANHKHLAHIAPSPGPASSSSSSQPLVAAAHQPLTTQPIGHITVAHLPGLYPQAVSVSQPTVVGHITHTFTHHTLPPHPHHPHHHLQTGPRAGANGGPVNGAPGLGSPSLGKPPTAVLAPHHHHRHPTPQLVGQTAVLNPVTMVTVPPFPVSTLKLV